MFIIKALGTVQNVEFSTRGSNHFLVFTLHAQQQNRYGTLVSHWCQCTIYDDMALKVRPNLNPHQWVYVEGLEDYYPYIGRKGKFEGLPTFKKKADLYMIRFPTIPGLEFHSESQIYHRATSSQSPDPETSDPLSHESENSPTQTNSPLPS